MQQAGREAARCNEHDACAAAALSGETPRASQTRLPPGQRRGQRRGQRAEAARRREATLTAEPYTVHLDWHGKQAWSATSNWPCSRTGT